MRATRTASASGSRPRCQTIDQATKNAKNQGSFVPLADVPDVIWKNRPEVPGGRDTAPAQGPEHPTHYADIDEPRATDGKTLRSCAPDRRQRDRPVLAGFLHRVRSHRVEGRGLLPFRVWQFFDAMVDALQPTTSRGTVAGRRPARPLRRRRLPATCTARMLADGVTDPGQARRQGRSTPRTRPQWSTTTRRSADRLPGLALPTTRRARRSMTSARGGRGRRRPS